MIDAIWEASSIYFTGTPLFWVSGLGIGALRQAPLNFTKRASLQARFQQKNLQVIGFFLIETVYD